jgi:hypothetical protein
VEKIIPRGRDGISETLKRLFRCVFLFNDFVGGSENLLEELLGGSTAGQWLDLTKVLTRFQMVWGRNCWFIAGSDQLSDQ